MLFDNVCSGVQVAMIVPVASTHYLWEPQMSALQTPKVMPCHAKRIIWRVDSAVGRHVILDWRTSL